jgi:anthranilate/para-aminobenzoate synthase component II
LIVRARHPLHGRASLIDHDGRGVLAGLPSPLEAGRYHSLVVERATLPAELEVTATSADGDIMALCHRSFPVHGVQFHPESVLTAGGHVMVGLNNSTITTIPLGEVVGRQKLVPLDSDTIQTARELGISLGD